MIRTGFFFILKFLFVGTLLIPTVCYSQSNETDVDEVSKAFEQIRADEANFLAPKKYKTVETAYNKYIKAVRGGKSEQDINKKRTFFNNALENANGQVKKANKILSKPLYSRSLALAEEADIIVPKSFNLAERRLSDATSKLEDGKIVEADQIGKEAITLYNVSKIAAVKSKLIGSAQSGINEAIGNKWDTLAPKSFNEAFSFINEVETALERGEKVTDELRNIAQNGIYKTRHAIWLAAKIDTLRKKTSNWETLWLSQENLVKQATDLTDISPDFITNSPQVILTESLNILTTRIDSLSQEFTRKDQHISTLQSTVDSLTAAINQQQIRLASMVENYQKDLQTRKEDLDLKRRELDADLRKKIQLDAVAQAQTRFVEIEAIVLREENEVLIRLVGLEFKAGKTNISEQGNRILDKLGNYLLLYPNTTVIVEGHTDSSGKEDKNLALSEERALTVRNYLISSSGLNDNQITSIGVGSIHPIVSNKTRRGRAQNRRIDIVISFKSDS